MERKKERKKDTWGKWKNEKWVASGGIWTHDTLHSGQMLLPVHVSVQLGTINKVQYLLGACRCTNDYRLLYNVHIHTVHVHTVQCRYVHVHCTYCTMYM